VLARARRILEGCKQFTVLPDPAAISRLPSKITGHEITAEAQGTYVNQLGEASEELFRAAYGPNYSRLAEIKKYHDPKTVPGLDQNIQ
jgi:hypothetical protein